jgi:Fic family protein
MKRKVVKDSRNGRLIRNSDGSAAFVPAPLPPNLTLTWATTKLLSEAERATGKLAGGGRLLPDPHILIQPFLRREAVLSSRIEGTQASLSDLIVFEASGNPEAERSDVREVWNYVRALEYGLQRLKELPLSQRFIREVHEILMSDVRGGTMTPGEFRTVQNWIGPPGASLATATYVPPPVPEMVEALNALERYIHADSDLPTLIRAALVHYQFEAIHPFLDGNGRLGRLLVMFLLHAEKVLDQPLLYLSAYFERHRAEYYRLLLDVSKRGAWTEWIDFFLRAVIEQANDGVKRTRELLDLARSYRARVRSARNLSRLYAIIDDLLIQPAITIPGLAHEHRMSYPAAKKNVDKLVAHRILERVRIARGSVYIAREVIEIVDAP